MARVPKPKLVELAGEYYHVGCRDPDEFDDIRTPERAVDAAATVSKGCKVRTETDDWGVQSVLIPKDAGKAAAGSRATAIVERLEA